MHAPSTRLPILHTPGMPDRFARLRFMSQPAGGDPAPAPTPTPPPAPAPAATAGDPPKPDDEPLGAGGIKALQAERDARAAAEAELAKVRKEIEDAGKTAEQKAADALKAAEDAAAKASTKAMKYEVAAAKGIDLQLATRLTGSTKEELEADADALKALLGGSTPAAPAAPRPDPSAGQGGATKPNNLSEAISAHYAAG